jgi:uncharacterized membrane protein HdeD (DUF308 family)
MATNIGGVDVFRQVLTQALREHWLPFLIEGVVLVVLGVLAILVPMVATVATVTLIGWLILISGIVGLAATVMARHTTGFWWSLVSGVLGVVVGIALLGGPTLVDVSFTLVLVVFFTVEGGAWCLYALEHKKNLSGPWSWMVVSGIVDLILAFMIFCKLPVTEAWAFGLMVGTSMLFGGISMIAMAAHAHGGNPGTRRTE